MRATEVLEVLERKRRRTFSTEELIEWTDASPVAARATVRRLRAERILASPVRGFHVLTPNRALGPPLEWVDPLMRRLGEVYGVAGWSAARLHGIASPPERTLTVRVHHWRRPIACAAGRIAFFTLGTRMNYEPRALDGPTGRVMVSSASDVLLELMMEASTRRGGLAAVLPALPALAKKADSLELAEAAADAPLTWSARLGYLLERAGHSSLAGTLAPLLDEFLTVDVALDPHASTDGARLDATWRVLVNTQLPRIER